MTTTATRRVSSALGLITALLLSLGILTACGGGSSSSGVPPQEAVAKAKKKLDEARSFRIALTTESVPTSTGVLGAEGVLTNQPAFEGKVKAVFAGVSTEVPVIAVDNKFYASILGASMDEIDPDEFGAPDPATFADPDEGISSLLNDLENLEETDSIRDGSEVLASYSGTLPGAAIKKILPSADVTVDFDTTLGINEDGQLTTLEAVGDFFGDGSEVTYNLRIDDYGADVTVKAP